MLFPEFPVVFDPFRRALHRLGNQAAAVDAPVLVPRHQARAFEHAKVFRHSGKGNVIWRGEFADRGFAMRELRENSAARRVGKSGESGIEGRRRIVNHMV